jgi:hypothetical protein
MLLLNQDDKLFVSKDLYDVRKNVLGHDNTKILGEITANRSRL